MGAPPRCTSACALPCLASLWITADIPAFRDEYEHFYDYKAL
jgi:hypothetical protein